MLMGTAASYCGRLDEALRHLDAAQEVDPLFPAIRANRGVAYYFARRFDDANRVYIELLTEYPQRTSTRLSLANSLMLCGALEAARNELNTVVEHDPTDAGARLSLAVLAARHGDLRGARKIVNAVRAQGSIERTNPSALGAAYAQLGDADEAVNWLTQAADAHEGGFAEVQVDPMLQPLASCEAFHSMLTRRGLQWIER